MLEGVLNAADADESSSSGSSSSSSNSDEDVPLSSLRSSSVPSADSKLCEEVGGGGMVPSESADERSPPVEDVSVGQSLKRPRLSTGASQGRMFQEGSPLSNR